MTPPDAEPTTKEPHACSDWECAQERTSLAAQVEALEAGIAAQVAFSCPHIDKHKLEERVAELEAERDRLRKGVCTLAPALEELCYHASDGSIARGRAALEECP